MSAGKKIATYFKENGTMLAFVGLIVGVHIGWYKIQNIPALVDPSEKKDLPIVMLFRYFKNQITGSNEYRATSITNTKES